MLEPPMWTQPALRLGGVAVGYGASTVLAGLDLEIARGELVGIVGPSGAGKTTLLRLITGQADWHRGRVEVLGRPLPARTSPRGVGYVPQLEGIDWDFPLTVAQVVLLGGAAESRRVPWFSRTERRRAAEVLERLGMAGLEDRQIRELSGGQQQRMFLARALAHKSELLVLDEPTSGVDLATRRDVLRLLGELRDEGLTVLLTTHDLNFVAMQLPRIVSVNGVVTADGDPRRVLDTEALRRTYGTPMRVVRDGDAVVVVDETPVLPERTAALGGDGHRPVRDDAASSPAGSDRRAPVGAGER
jgi:ABC-type Mn2+/Zn2+ transport system ATPase subunit